MRRVIVFYPGTVPVMADDLTETPHIGATLYRGGCKWQVKDVVYDVDARQIQVFVIP